MFADSAETPESSTKDATSIGGHALPVQTIIFLYNLEPATQTVSDM